MLGSFLATETEITMWQKCILSEITETRCRWNLGLRASCCLTLFKSALLSKSHLHINPGRWWLYKLHDDSLYTSHGESKLLQANNTANTNQGSSIVTKRMCSWRKSHRSQGKTLNKMGEMPCLCTTASHQDRQEPQRSDRKHLLEKHETEKGQGLCCLYLLSMMCHRDVSGFSNDTCVPAAGNQQHTLWNINSGHTCKAHCCGWNRGSNVFVWCLLGSS